MTPLFRGLFDGMSDAEFADYLKRNGLTQADVEQAKQEVLISMLRDHHKRKHEESKKNTNT